MDEYDVLFERITSELTPEELRTVLEVAKATLDDPYRRGAVERTLGLEYGDCYGLLHSITEVLGGTNG